RARREPSIILVQAYAIFGSSPLTNARHAPLPEPNDTAAVFLRWTWNSCLSRALLTAEGALAQVLRSCRAPAAERPSAPSRAPQEGLLQDRARRSGRERPMIRPRIASTSPTP